MVLRETLGLGGASDRYRYRYRYRYSYSYRYWVTAM